MIYKLSTCFLAMTICFLALSCTDREFENPLDPTISLKPPTISLVTLVSDTTVTAVITNPNKNINYPNAEVTYEIEQSINDTTHFIAIKSFVGETATIAGTFYSAYIYYFRVRAVTLHNVSSYSTVVQSILTFPAPSNLSIEITETTAVLHWQNNSTLTKQIILERSTSQTSGFFVVDSVQYPATTKSISGIYQTDLTYYFRVRAKSLHTVSSYSPIAQSILNFPAPSNLSVAITETTAVLQWQNNSTLTKKIMIERSISQSNSYSVVDSITYPATTKSVFEFYHTDTTYYFRVRAKSLNNISGYASVAQSTLLFTTPSNLSVASIAETTAVLQWQNNSTLTKKIMIERSISQSNGYSVVDSITYPATTKSVFGVYHTDTTYYFRVQAKSLNNFSGYSNAANKTFPCGTPTVTYMGKTYTTVRIGTQCWFKENLNVGTMISGSSTPTNNSTIEKYCYGNNAVNCSTYGGLYQWNEAMQYSTSAGTQGICPTGWHIPTDSEFQTLKTFMNNDGNALKAVGQGTGSGAGTNTSGFSLLFSGYRNYDGGFTTLAYYANYWSSTEYDAAYAYNLALYTYASDIFVSNFNFKVSGFSVRCLKD